MLVDTHAHLYWDSFENDLDEVIRHAVDAGVATIINVGVDIDKSEAALQQAQRITTGANQTLKLYSTIGIHPHEAIKYQVDNLAADIEKLEYIYRQSPKKVIGVGECGLDYFFLPEYIPLGMNVEDLKDLQRKLFQAQIDLAKKLTLPLIVHCRDDRSKKPENSEAWDEVLKMVGNHPTILHCYSGLPHTTNYLLDRTNLLVSFAATITYPKNQYLRDTAKILPLEKIVLETDCPFLPSQSKRGQRNEPQTVKEIAELIADLKKLPFEVVADQTTKNVKRVFNI